MVPNEHHDTHLRPCLMILIKDVVKKIPFFVDFVPFWTIYLGSLYGLI